MTVSEFAGNIDLNQITITDHKGALVNSYVTGTLGLKAGGDYPAAPVFRYLPSVRVNTLKIIDLVMTDVYFVENAACTTQLTSMLFSFPGDPNGPYLTTMTIDKSTLPISELKTLQCKSCTLPLINLGSNVYPININNLKFTSINSLASVSTPSYNPLFHFELK